MNTQYYIFFPLLFLFSTYVFIRLGYINPLSVLCLFVLLFDMIQVSLHRAFNKAHIKFKENNTSLSDEEKMNKRRRCSIDDNGEKMNKRRGCSIDDNGLCSLPVSAHRCHCLCGCKAFSTEHVRCVHCRNYIIDNSALCQCSFFVHSLTDDAICHICHKNEYITDQSDTSPCAEQA